MKHQISWRAAGLFLYLFTGIFAMLFGPQFLNLNANPGFENIAPGLNFFFGTDQLGRSVASLVIAGTHTAILVGGIAALVATGIGTFIGAISAWKGRTTDATFMWIAGAFQALPGIVMVMVLAVVFGDGIVSTSVAIGIGGWVGSYRLARAETQRLRSQPFIDNARLCGSNTGQILKRHLVPNLSPLAMSQFQLYFVYAIKAEVILAFLGIGNFDHPSWGAIISQAQHEIPNGIWWPLASVTLALGGLVLLVQSFTHSVSKNPSS